MQKCVRIRYMNAMECISLIHNNIIRHSAANKFRNDFTSLMLSF